MARGSTRPANEKKTTLLGFEHVISFSGDVFLERINVGVNRREQLLAFTV